MTELLKRAFDEASQLPEDQQDWLAGLVLTEIRVERKWDELLEHSAKFLANLAEDALLEDERGKTENLDLGPM